MIHIDRSIPLRKHGSCSLVLPASAFDPGHGELYVVQEGQLRSFSMCHKMQRSSKLSASVPPSVTAPVALLFCQSVDGLMVAHLNAVYCLSGTAHPPR